jgi:hypothetical protein
MQTDKHSDKQGLPAAGTGNASNPSPNSEAEPGKNQLLDERAEKYLREVSSPEDYADPEDAQDMDEQLKDQ